jgi:hypothetical protein
LHQFRNVGKITHQKLNFTPKYFFTTYDQKEPLEFAKETQFYKLCQDESKVDFVALDFAVRQKIKHDENEKSIFLLNVSMNSEESTCENENETVEEDGEPTRMRNEFCKINFYPLFETEAEERGGFFDIFPTERSSMFKSGVTRLKVYPDYVHALKSSRAIEWGLPAFNNSNLRKKIAKLRTFVEEGKLKEVVEMHQSNIRFEMTFKYDSENDDSIEQAIRKVHNKYFNNHTYEELENEFKINLKIIGLPVLDYYENIKELLNEWSGHNFGRNENRARVRVRVRVKFSNLNKAILRKKISFAKTEKITFSI